MYLGTVYLSDENRSKNILEKLKLLSDKIEMIKQKSREILLQGDFNARTSTEKDIVNSARFDRDVDVEQLEVLPRVCSIIT